MGENLFSSNGISWRTVENDVKKKLVDGSLLHTLILRKKIKRRTRILNEELKKLGVLKCYKKYIKIKTDILRDITDNDETDDEICSDDEEELTCALLEKQVSYPKSKRSSSKVSGKTHKKRQLLRDNVSIDSSVTTKSQKVKARRSAENVADTADKVIDENEAPLLETKVDETKVKKSPRRRKREISNPEKESIVKKERDKIQKKNGEIMNLETPVNISQPKTFANAKRNLTNILDDLDKSVQKSKDKSARNDASQIIDPLEQSTQLSDVEFEDDSQSYRKNKHRYSLSLSKQKPIENEQHDIKYNEEINKEIQDTSLLNNVVEYEGDSQEISDANDSQEIADANDNRVYKNDCRTNENLAAENSIPATKLNKTIESDSEEDTIEIKEEDNPKESINNESMTKKSQPVIKSTEIVKSKYTIIRDDEEVDEIAIDSMKNSLDYSPNYPTSQDDDVIESDELTPETRRLRQLKRINLLSSSYDSDSSDDTFNTKRDREDVMIWAKEEIPQNMSDFDSTFGSLDTDISDVESIASQDFNEKKQNELSEANHLNDTASQNSSVTKSLKSQIEEQMKNVSTAEKKKNVEENEKNVEEDEKDVEEVEKDVEEVEKNVEENEKDNENDDNSSDFCLTLEESPSDENSTDIACFSKMNSTAKRDMIKKCKNGMNVVSKEQSWLSTSKSVSNAQPTEAESLQCILQNMARKNNNNNNENDLFDCQFRGYNQPVHSRKQIASRDCSEERAVEIIPRSVELNEYAARQGLISNSDSSSITLKDVKNCIDENDDEEMWIMEVPKSVVFDANLCGRKVILKKKTMKIGDVSYETICRQDEPLSCIFRSKKKKIRYKTVNITPIGSIVIQNEHSTMETPPTSSNPLRHSQDFVESPNTNGVPFPKNIKSRNPLLPVNVSKELIDQTIVDSQESQVSQDSQNSSQKAINNANESRSKIPRKRKSNKFGSTKETTKTKEKRLSSGIIRKRKDLKRSDGAVKKIESRRTVAKGINNKLKKMQNRWSLHNFISKSKKEKPEFPLAKSLRQSL